MKLSREVTSKSVLDEEDDEYADFEFESITAKRKEKIKNFVERVKKTQETMRKRAHLALSTSAYVKEGVPPEFDVDLSFLLELFAPRRKLKPKKKDRKPAVRVDNCSLIIQVVQAANVPVRREESAESLALQATARQNSPVRGRRTQRDSSSRAGAAARDDMDDFDFDDDARFGMVNSYIEVEFQGKTYRTDAHTGPHPKWNEKMTCKFTPTGPNGTLFEPSNLCQIQDKVTFSLFDEVTYDMAVAEHKYRKAKADRKEKRFLGSFSLPFATIYMEGKVQGNMRVDRPEVNLGYGQSSFAEAMGRSQAATAAEMTDEELDVLDLNQRAEETTYVTIMATLNPVLSVPETKSEQYAPGEGANLKHKIKNFQEMLKAKWKRNKVERSLECLALTLEGESALVCKFLRKQRPIPAALRRGKEWVFCELGFWLRHLLRPALPCPARPRVGYSLLSPNSHT